MKKCENCGSKFSRSDNLKRHQNNNCKAQNKPGPILDVKRKYEAAATA